MLKLSRASERKQMSKDWSKDPNLNTDHPARWYSTFIRYCIKVIRIHQRQYDAPTRIDHLKDLVTESWSRHRVEQHKERHCASVGS